MPCSPRRHMPGCRRLNKRGENLKIKMPQQQEQLYPLRESVVKGRTSASIKDEHSGGKNSDITGKNSLITCLCPHLRNKTKKPVFYKIRTLIKKNPREAKIFMLYFNTSECHTMYRRYLNRISQACGLILYCCFLLGGLGS